ncbi:MAG: hypothetical protein J0G32_02140 [Alphaproteobacteria bacterium]|nr:hypothetical protein [Alphaproteobacteria bacterium]OJV12237.1 MAG: hypothetical protein BGO27_05825 [Alphaproteobacteria bacterium 33-17]
MAKLQFNDENHEKFAASYAKHAKIRNVSQKGFFSKGTLLSLSRFALGAGLSVLGFNVFGLLLGSAARSSIFMAAKYVSAYVAGSFLAKTDIYRFTFEKIICKLPIKDSTKTSIGNTMTRVRDQHFIFCGWIEKKLGFVGGIISDLINPYNGRGFVEYKNDVSDKYEQVMTQSGTYSSSLTHRVTSKVHGFTDLLNPLTLVYREKVVEMSDDNFNKVKQELGVQ